MNSHIRPAKELREVEKDERCQQAKVSRFIVGSYAILVIFIAVCIAFFVYASLFTLMGTLGRIAATVLILVESIMLLILTSIYRTKYVLRDEELIIKATRLIGGNKHIHLIDVVHAEKKLIPFSVRLFGASLYGGH